MTKALPWDNPNSDPIGDVRRYAEMIASDKFRAEGAAIERACEASIQGGNHGVLVVRSMLDGALLSAEPNANVPYGQVYEKRVRA